ncbi:hypothetical protein B0H11DRAFT_908579 [Mycena galericulata]|nr:hypothetical protein B0H11DRAFT_908579 [Mycena galericulata]
MEVVEDSATIRPTGMALLQVGQADLVVRLEAVAVADMGLPVAGSREVQEVGIVEISSAKVLVGMMTEKRNGQGIEGDCMFRVEYFAGCEYAPLLQPLRLSCKYVSDGNPKKSCLGYPFPAILGGISLLAAVGLRPRLILQGRCAGAVCRIGLCSLGFLHPYSNSSLRRPPIGPTTSVAAHMSRLLPKRDKIATESNGGATEAEGGNGFLSVVGEIPDTVIRPECDF